MISSHRKLMFFVTVDWFFCSHFLERAIAARDAGYEVVVLTHVGTHGDLIREAGLRLIHLPIDRRSVNPFAGMRTVASVFRTLRAEKPDILHQVALKPILIGSFAAKLNGNSRLVNAVVGAGYMFSSNSLTARLLRPLIRLGLRSLLNPRGSKVVFENDDDLRTFVDKRYVRDTDALIIAGAGVKPDAYNKADVLKSPPLVVLVARLLWDKGIGEFVGAAREIRRMGVAARFVVVGDMDPDNRGSIAADTIEKWRDEGVVEFWGFRSDVSAILERAAIACLPSYREGLPKSLLEAMAAGLPCVATDVPGCRLAVHDGDNGLLVPPRDVEALKNALVRLIEDPSLRYQMGSRGRARVEAEFSSDRVIGQTLDLYKLIQSD